MYLDMQSMTFENLAAINILYIISDNDKSKDQKIDYTKVQLTIQYKQRATT